MKRLLRLAPLVFIACAAPDQPGSLLAHALGYAVVAVNMRGTGCSGGSYDFFEPLQLLDGYDIVETVAAQDWVKNNKVVLFMKGTPHQPRCGYSNFVVELLKKYGKHY